MVTAVETSVGSIARWIWALLRVGFVGEGAPLTS